MQHVLAVCAQYGMHLVHEPDVLRHAHYASSTTYTRSSAKTMTMTQLKPPSTFTALGTAAFVSLTTFRKTGARVATPVWCARDADALIVVTPADSGKVKRVRNDGRVELQPSGRTGKVAAVSEAVTGYAEIVTDPATTARLTRLFQQKYGLEYRLVMLIERIAARKQKARVMLRITATAPQR